MTQTQLSQEEATDLLCKHYGVEATGNAQVNVKNLSTTKRFQEIYRDLNSVPATLTRMGTDVNNNDTVNAWFFKNGGTRKDYKENKWVQHEGIQAFLPNGRTFPVDGPQDPKATPLKTTIKVSGVKTITNVLTGDVTIKNLTNAKAVYAQHDDPLPTVSAKEHIESCFQVNKNLGTIYGSTGDYPRFIGMEIGTDDGDVAYWPEGNYAESLTVTAYAHDVDKEGNPVRTAIDVKVKDVAAVRDALNLGPDADRDDFHAALAGDMVYAYGKIEVDSGKGESYFADGALDAAISQLDQQGYMSTYETKNGTVQQMDLSKADATMIYIKNKEGKDVRVYNLKYDFDKRVGEFAWQARVDNRDLGKNPHMFTHTTEYTAYVKDPDNPTGEKIPEQRFWNPGAFVLFGSTLGGNNLRVDDAFAGLDDVALDNFNGVDAQQPIQQTANLG